MALSVIFGRPYSGVVDTFADLPDPVGRNNQLWLVKTSTGVPLINYRPSGTYYSDGISWTHIGSGDGSAIWGNITGTLSNQIDLQAALDNKISKDGTTTTTAIIPFGTLGLSTSKITNLAGFGSGNVRVNNSGTLSVDSATYLTTTTGDTRYLRLDGANPTTGLITFGAGFFSPFFAIDALNGIIQNVTNVDLSVSVGGITSFIFGQTSHRVSADMNFGATKVVGFGSVTTPNAGISSDGTNLTINSRITGSGYTLFPYELRVAQSADVYSLFGAVGTSTVITPSDATDRLVAYKVDTSTATAARRAGAFIAEGGATSNSTVRLIGANNIAVINSSATGNYTSTTNGGGASGMRAIAANESTTTVVTMGGAVSGKVQGKTFTDAYNFLGELPTVDSAITWATFSHYWAKFGTPTGTITTGYGVKIDSIGAGFATTSYQIALDGVGARSGVYFNTPSAAGLDYIRDVTAGNLLVNGNTTSALGVAGTAVVTASSTVATFAQRLNIPSVAASAATGDFWLDSTQKSLSTFTNGIRQILSGTIFTQTADKTVTNTVTETTILGTGVGTVTLPANFFMAGKTVRIRIGGIYTTPLAATPSIIVKVKYGSTVIATVTTTALLSGATNLEFDGEVLITCRSAGIGGSVMVHGDIEYSTGVAGTVAVDPLNNAGAVTNIDTTAATALDITVQWDTATSTRSVTSTITAIEVLN